LNGIPRNKSLISLETSNPNRASDHATGVALFADKPPLRAYASAVATSISADARSISNGASDPNARAVSTNKSIALASSPGADPRSASAPATSLANSGVLVAVRSRLFPLHADEHLHQPSQRERTRRRPFHLVHILSLVRRRFFSREHDESGGGEDLFGRLCVIHDGARGRFRRRSLRAHGDDDGAITTTWRFPRRRRRRRYRSRDEGGAHGVGV
jgi:hypothetical protein